MTETKTHWKDVAIEGMTEWERNFYEGKDAGDIVEFFLLPQADILRRLINDTVETEPDKKFFLTCLQSMKDYAEYIARVSDYLIQREQSDYEF